MKNLLGSVSSAVLILGLSLQGVHAMKGKGDPTEQSKSNRSNVKRKLERVDGSPRKKQKRMHEASESISFHNYNLDTDDGYSFLCAGDDAIPLGTKAKDATRYIPEFQQLVPLMTFTRLVRNTPELFKEIMTYLRKIIIDTEELKVYNDTFDIKAIQNLKLVCKTMTDPVDQFTDSNWTFIIRRNRDLPLLSSHPHLTKLKLQMAIPCETNLVLPNLRKLHINPIYGESLNLTLEHFNFFFTLTQLDTLNMSRVTLVEGSVVGKQQLIDQMNANLATMTNLTNLRLPVMDPSLIQEKSLRFLTKLTGLTNLDIPITLDGSEVKVITDEELGCMTQLKKLNLVDCGRKVDVSLLSNLINLEDLVISGDFVTNVTDKTLDRCTKLKKLHIYGADEIYNDDLPYASLSKLVNLKNLTIYDCQRLRCDDLKPLTQIQVLSFENLKCPEVYKLFEFSNVKLFDLSDETESLSYKQLTGMLTKLMAMHRAEGKKFDGQLYEEIIETLGKLNNTDDNEQNNIDLLCTLVRKVFDTHFEGEKKLVLTYLDRFPKGMDPFSEH